jgi:hypothetical protein
MVIARMALALSLSPLALLAPAASVVVVPGCGCSGGAAGLPGLLVWVDDGPGGPAVCGATVTARDGARSETLVPVELTPGDCYYVGAVERPGTYTIEVTSGGRSVTVMDVRVAAGDCHVRQASITATLPPRA